MLRHGHLVHPMPHITWYCGSDLIGPRDGFIHTTILCACHIRFPDEHKYMCIFGYINIDGDIIFFIRFSKTDNLSQKYMSFNKKFSSAEVDLKKLRLTFN